MYVVEPRNIAAMSKAAALESQFVEQALANVSGGEMVQIQQDIKDFEYGMPWSSLIVEVMQRAKCIADAENIIARLESTT